MAPDVYLSGWYLLQEMQEKYLALSYPLATIILMPVLRASCTPYCQYYFPPHDYTIDHLVLRDRADDGETL